MIKFVQKGNFRKTEVFLSRVANMNYRGVLDKYGEEGVRALSSSTPIDSGETANSWSYEVIINSGSASIIWTNSNIVGGIPVVILIQYGHGTKNGAYVEGYDFINPTMKPIFARLADEIWREVTRL